MVKVKTPVRSEHGEITGNMQLRVHALLEEGQVQVKVVESSKHNIRDEPIVSIPPDNLEPWCDDGEEEEEEE